MNKQSIRVENLVKSFGKGDSLVDVIDKASFSVDTGELIALIAPSGAGKTTLLMMIGCVEEPTSGQIWLGDEKVYDNWCIVILKFNFCKPSSKTRSSRRFS